MPLLSGTALHFWRQETSPRRWQLPTRLENMLQSDHSSLSKP